MKDATRYEKLNIESEFIEIAMIFWTKISHIKLNVLDFTKRLTKGKNNSMEREHSPTLLIIVLNWFRMLKKERKKKRKFFFPIENCSTKKKKKRLVSDALTVSITEILNLD